MTNSKIAYLIPLALPIAALAGYVFQIPMFMLSLTLISFLVMGFIDNLLKRDASFAFSIVKAIPENEGNIENGWANFIIYLFIFLYFLVLSIGIYYAQYKTPTWSWMLYAVLISLVSGELLNVCHELMHSKKYYKKILSRIVSSFCFWSVHEYEHLFYHHNDEIICTEQDKSYAKLNQSVYSFIIQSILFNYKHAWETQHKICSRMNQSFYSINNGLLQSLLLSTVISILILYFIGLYGFLFFIIQALGGIAMFVIGTYNQHYGLSRRKSADGHYEPFTIMNIWSSDHYLGSRLNFNTTHHTHHHMYQFCRYPYLEIIDHSPLLPYDYLLSIFICLIPPLWYKIMNKRVAEIYLLREEYEKNGTLIK